VNLPEAFADTRIRQHAGFEADCGDLAAECRAALDGGIVAVLPQLGIIRASGVDTDSFLQGQFSNDIRLLTAERAQLTSWNSAKGRVLALFTALRSGDAVLLETARPLVEATLKRLRMFVLRSKVQLEDVSESSLAIGIGGERAGAQLAALGLPAPADIGGVAVHDNVVVLRRSGARPRYTLHGSAEQLRPLWQKLSAELTPAGTAAWRLLDILAGVPTILAATQDHFVAQMLNLDALGGISFTKGCYTGQEVVARMHYLGNLKRRMFLLHAEGAEAVAPATSIYEAGGDGQAVGEVVLSAPHPDRAQALLAVLQIAHAESATLRLGSVDGPRLGPPTALI